MKNIKQYLNEMIKMYENGDGTDTIGLHYGCSGSYVWRILTDAGVVMRQNNKLTEAQELALVYDYVVNKMKTADLSKKHNLCRSACLVCLHKHGAIVHEGKRKMFFKDNDFFKKITEESLWILGWFYSDGNVDMKKNGFSVATHLNDVAVLRKIRNILMSGSKDDDYIHFRKKQKCVILSFCDKEMRKDLINLGCVPNKSLTVTYPSFFTEDWQHLAFLRGVFEGDGSVWFSGKMSEKRANFGCSVASASWDFCLSLQKTLKERWGIESRLHLNHKDKSKITGVDFSRKIDSYKFLKLIYPKSDLHCSLDRKIKKAYEAFLLFENKKAFNAKTNRSAIVYFLKDGIIYKTNAPRRFAESVGIGRTTFYSIINGDIKETLTGWSKPTEDQIKVAGENIVEKLY